MFSKWAFLLFLNFTDNFYRFFGCWHSEGEGHNENCHYRVLKIEVTQLLPPALDSSRRVVSGGIRPESITHVFVLEKDLKAREFQYKHYYKVCLFR